jgi:iron complex outermembrane receptor protein
VNGLIAGFRHDGLLFGDPGQGLPLAVYDLRRQNFADEKIKGLDYAFSYRWQTGASQFNAGIAGTQFFTFFQQIPGLTQTVPLLDTNYSIRQRIRGNLGWGLNDVRVQLFANYTGSYRNPNVTPTQEVESFTTVDLIADWKLPGSGILENTTLGVQVQNLFDEEPPFLRSGSNGNGFDAAVANAFGRQAIVSLRKVW